MISITRRIVAGNAFMRNSVIASSRRSLSCQYLCSPYYQYVHSGLEKRLFSSVSDEEKCTNESETKKIDAAKKSSSTSTSTLLYKAVPSKAHFPRGLLAFTTIHTSYWTWYLVDFTPALKAAAVDPSTVDSTVAYLGLGLSIFMSIGSILYPTSLLSELSLSKKDKDKDDEKGTTTGAGAGAGADHVVEIKTYSLPFVQPSSSSTEYKLGELVVDSPNDVTKIITDYNGDFSKFPGHLALHAKGKNTNLLMNVNEHSKEEIMDNDLLLETLKPGQQKLQLYVLPKSKAAKEPFGGGGEEEEQQQPNQLSLKRRKKGGSRSNRKSR